MSANHKLTAVLAGRTLTGVDHTAGSATLRFGDGSIMTVRLADEATLSANPPSAGGV